MSHPSWVCGLKPLGGRAHGIWVRVTPFVGVWIETWVGINWRALLTVTPFVGVWIETNCDEGAFRTSKCHTLRGCVDWNFGHAELLISWYKSHPSWVCGLKLRNCCETNCEGKSHPSWVCGLKHAVGREIWETRSHTLRGCVDWNRKQILFSEPTWKSHFYENVPLIVNKLQWQKIWFGTSLSGLSLVLYSNL